MNPNPQPQDHQATSPVAPRTDPAEIVEDSLSLVNADALKRDFLTLPRAAMSEVGSAALTLGALYRACRRDGSTFQSVKKIAQVAGVSLPTCRRHLKKLCAEGWIDHEGRCRFAAESRRLRRTVTYRLEKKANENREPFGMLPRWSCEVIERWASKAVFSLIVSRWMLIEQATKTGTLENREMMSLTEIQRHTGLTRSSVCDAFQDLERIGLVDRRYLEECDEESGDAKAVFLSDEYRVPSHLLRPSESDADRGLKPTHTQSETDIDPSPNLTPPQSDSESEGSPNLIPPQSDSDICYERELIGRSNEGELIKRRYETQHHSLTERCNTTCSNRSLSQQTPTPARVTNPADQQSASTTSHCDPDLPIVSFAKPKNAGDPTDAQVTERREEVIAILDRISE